MKNFQKRVTTGVFLLKDQEILFLVRDKKTDAIHTKGMYLPIGGHVEFNEDIETAAKREVLEESGITVNSLMLCGIVHFRGQQEEHDMTMFVFISNNFSGNPVTGSEGYFEWVPIKDIFDKQIYDGDKIFIKFMLENKFFVIDFLFNGNKMIDHKVLTLIPN